MNLSILLSIIATIFFGGLAILLSIKEQKTKLLLAQERKQKKTIREAAILKEIENRIGYTLNAEKIADALIGSLKSLISHSTTSSMIIKDNMVFFKTYLEEPVSRTFIDSVRKNMLGSLNELTENVPQALEESLFGLPLNGNGAYVGSFFNIPVILNDNLITLLNISSAKSNIYNEEEITNLYEITNNAMESQEKFQSAIFAEKEKLSSMIASLVDGALMVDSKNNLLVINQAARKFLNINKVSPTFFDIVAAMPKDFDITSKIASSSHDKKLIEKEIVIGEKTFEIYINHLSNKRTSVLFHDITTEKSLASLKEDFTNMVVHELRSPLIAIKDSSDVIISDKYNLSDEEKKQFLGIINRQSRSLIDQIGSILDSAKLDAGKFTITTAKGSLAKVIKEEIAIFTPAATKKQISLKLNIPLHLPDFSFDATRIGQVMNNLLSNSLKFTKEGGEIHASVSYSPDDDKFISVSVSDTGIGIPKEAQKNLFTKFSQARTTPQQLVKQGTGLGLYVVKGIIEAHKGNVSVESELGKGTRISFSLPIQDNSVYHQTNIRSTINTPLN